MMIAAMIAAATTATSPQPPPVARTVTVVIKTSTRDAAADGLIRWAEARGGYFPERTDERLTLRVPVAQTEALLAHAATLGTVAQQTEQAEDLAVSLRKTETMLRSRKEVLERYFAVLDHASPSTVVTVEREMTTLVQQIEVLEGQVRLMRHRMAWAKIIVDFAFPQRRMPLANGDSSFDWLNSVNLVDHVQEFQDD